MKDLQKMEQKVLNALKIIFIFFLFVFINSCGSNTIHRNNNEKYSTYEIEKHKAKGYFTGVTVEALDDYRKNLLLSPTVIINNVYLRGKTFKLGLGVHNIIIIHIGKRDVFVNDLEIMKNDSIVIKTIMKGETIID